MLTIIEALKHPSVFGALPAFRDLRTWRRWIVFLKATYGLPLGKRERAIFREHTGRGYRPPKGGWSLIVAITGRQSGKTRVATLIADFEAIRSAPPNDGTDIFAILVGQDARASMRTLLSFARSPFEVVPELKASVLGATGDTIRLTSGVAVAAYPCRPQSVRGLRAAVVVLDEFAHFRTSENLPVDVEMLRAIRPTLATTDGKLIILSSPAGMSGELYRLHRRYFGRADKHVLVWAASAPQMNPTLSRDYLARMRQDDPEGFRAEVLGEFRQGTSTFLDAETIQAAVPEGVREIPPREGVSYHAFVDPSGGRRDRFTLGISHREDRLIVLDCVRSWSPPFNPSGVVAECAEILRRYRCSGVEGDRYSGEFVREQFRSHGISYRPSELDKSAIYLEFMALLNSGAVRLLDLPELLREMRGLERRVGSSGRDRVDHGAGGHDDIANGAAGSLRLAARAGAGQADISEAFVSANTGFSESSGIRPAWTQSAHERAYTRSGFKSFGR